jgi:hypothetical protein
MHYHGADGIHANVDPATGTLALYWGESKLHATASGAIEACFGSLAPFLVSAGGSGAPQERDLTLLSDNLDLDDPGLEAAIARYLDRDDPSFNKLVYCGVALVGFDEASYADGTPPVTEAVLATSLDASTTSWHKSVSHYVGKHNLTDIGIELFCLPFPSVEAFRAAFLRELGLR